MLRCPRFYRTIALGFFAALLAYTALYVWYRQARVHTVRGYSQLPPDEQPEAHVLLIRDHGMETILYSVFHPALQCDRMLTGQAVMRIDSPPFFDGDE